MIDLEMIRARLGKGEGIAEGVETAEQLTVLRTAGVWRMQGHYCSQSLRAETFLLTVQGAPIRAVHMP